MYSSFPRRLGRISLSEGVTDLFVDIVETESEGDALSDRDLSLISGACRRGL